MHKTQPIAMKAKIDIKNNSNRISDINKNHRNSNISKLQRRRHSCGCPKLPGLSASSTLRCTVCRANNPDPIITIITIGFLLVCLSLILSIPVMTITTTISKKITIKHSG